MRIWMEEGDWGRVEDLGPATQERDTSIPYNTFLDHCGGLTFGADGMLGLPAQMLGELVLGFYLFAGVMMGMGGGEFFLKLATAIAGTFATPADLD